MPFTRFTIFNLFYLVGTGIGGWVGFTVGRPYGMAGSIIGVIVGGFLGALAGSIPDRLAYRAMVREIMRNSNDELCRIVDEPDWNFRHTLALLQLSARGENVTAHLPRLMEMLESDVPAKRLHGWDAVRIVFPPHAERLEGFDPRATVEQCRDRVAQAQGARRG